MSNGFEKDDTYEESLTKVLEMVGEKSTSKSTEKPVKNPYDFEKHLHDGHRRRVYEAADKDFLLDTFSEVEALEYVLFAALPRVDTNKIAHRLLYSFGSLSGVFAANIADLVKINGISKRVAYFLKAIPAIARKSQLTRIKPQTIKTINDALDYLKSFFEYAYTETMYVMSLDISDRVLGVDCVTALGTATGNNVSVPAIMDSVCRHHGTKVIVAHNHPGGIMLPSKQDLSLTDLIIDSLAALDIVLVDHLIFSSENSFLSFFNSGIIHNMYRNFDFTHGSNMMRFLPEDEPHSLSSGTEYLFDIKTATLIRKSEYFKFFSECLQRAKDRTSFVSEYGKYKNKNDDDRN